MHTPQHLPQSAEQQHNEEGPLSPVSQDRPVIHRSATQQRYAKSRFLMRLPRRHVVQRTSAVAREFGEEGDHHHHHYSSTADDYDFVESLLEADEDTAFIDNLIGASTRKKQEDLDGPSPHHQQSHYTSSLEIMAKQPLRRIRLVGRRVMYSLGTFILFYSFLSFWQSRKSKFSWRSYKENLHQNFAASPDKQHSLRGGGGGGGGMQYDYVNNNPQNRRMYDSSQSQPRNHQQALSPLSQNSNNINNINNNNNLQQQQQQQQAIWSAGRDDTPQNRLSSSQQLQQQGRFAPPFNGYPSNNNMMQQQQPLAAYNLGNPSLFRDPNGFSTASTWMDNGKASLVNDGIMDGANVQRRSAHTQQQQQQQQQQQLQSRNMGDSSAGNKKSRKGWRLLLKKEKPEASSVMATTGNRYDDAQGSAAAAASVAAVKAASLLSSSSSSSLLMDPALGGAGNGNYIGGNAQMEMRRPYTHGYD